MYGLGTVAHSQPNIASMDGTEIFPSRVAQGRTPSAEDSGVIQRYDVGVKDGYLRLKNDLVLWFGMQPSDAPQLARKIMYHMSDRTVQVQVFFVNHIFRRALVTSNHHLSYQQAIRIIDADNVLDMVRNGRSFSIAIEDGSYDDCYAEVLKGFRAIKQLSLQKEAKDPQVRFLQDIFAKITVELREQTKVNVLQLGLDVFGVPPSHKDPYVLEDHPLSVRVSIYVPNEELKAMMIRVFTEEYMAKHPAFGFALQSWTDTNSEYPRTFLDIRPISRAELTHIQGPLRGVSKAKPILFPKTTE